ncbi:general stress protein [Schaalia sp. ZJ1691]|uniref:general stress protein n=1 Tax=Schaalia sp. ZJ1691 TaxID=2709404 RepID=UPI0019805B4A|nr:general stress protein [Schaalia sp. ZJ1691]
MAQNSRGGAPWTPTMPSGTEVASYKTYAEAQGGVDFLSDQMFDVKSITIVGTDLHMVERVTGRLTMARSALSGATTGVLWGALMGMMVSFSTQSTGASLWILIGMLGGALVGTLMSAIGYAMSGGRRDFTSHSQVVASRYAVLASAEIDKAFELLQKTPGNMMRPKRAPRPQRSGPTEYGSRLDEKPRFGVRKSAQSSTDEDQSPQPSPAEEESSSHESSVASEVSSTEPAKPETN